MMIHGSQMESGARNGEDEQERVAVHSEMKNVREKKFENRIGFF